MLLDNEAKFSAAQAITANAASTNVVKFSGEPAFGTPVPLLIQVVQAFNNLTSLKVAVQTATDSAFTTPVELASYTLNLADLKAGATFPINQLPKGNLGYIRLYYTVTGTAPTLGAITAGVVASLDQHN